MQDEVKVNQAAREARFTLTALARIWWGRKMKSHFHSASIKGDGRVDVHWHDDDESGRYTLPVDFVAEVLPQAERDTLARMEWRDIESAPYNTPVEIKVGSMTFLARLHPDASMSSLDESCDQWQAEIDGEHPPCWSGGACWASNENEDMSLQPTAWRYPPAPEAGQ